MKQTLALSLVLAACGRGDAPKPKRDPGPPPEPAPYVAPEAPAPAGPDPGAANDDDVPPEHRVILADRTSQGYLLLLPPGDEPKPPTRAELDVLVRATFSDRAELGEAQLLLDLIATKPHDTQLTADARGDLLAAMSDPEGRLELAPDAEAKDLLGLFIARLDLRSAEEAVIPEAALTDPILLRALTVEQVRSLPERRWAFLIRADYRNRYDVRGLRLLQTLVPIVAKKYGALIFDPDTLETVDVGTFEAKRLRPDASNVADQIAVVPFPDPRHGADHVRLATRGMRRFGALDLELDGLTKDPDVLMRATWLLQGLALTLVELGEVDETGLAVELEQTLRLTRKDALLAAGGDPSTFPPRCTDCAEGVDIHLVKRAPEAHDPRDHVVARVVAPRARSEAADYRQPDWSRQAIESVFGKLPEPLR